MIEFQGPTGFWVRIRPEHDDRAVATEIAQQLKPSEGTAWLVPATIDEKRGVRSRIGPAPDFRTVRAADFHCPKL